MCSITHKGYYHELYKLSNTTIVLVFSVMTSFVRMILQREENKGVELTMCPCNSMRAALLAGEDFFEEGGDASGGLLGGICKCVSALPAGNFPTAHCSVHLIANSCAIGYNLCRSVL